MIHPDMTEAEVPSRIAELERRCSELEASRAADLESAVLLAQYLATLDKRLADIEGSEDDEGTTIGLPAYKCSTFVRGEPRAVRNPWTGEFAEPDE